MSKYINSMEVLAEIGIRLKAYRINSHLSQKELAEKSGVSIKSISRIENGEDMQFSNIARLLIALDVDDRLDLVLPDPRKRLSGMVRKGTEPTLKQRAGRQRSITKKVEWEEDKNR